MATTVAFALPAAKRPCPTRPPALDDDDDDDEEEADTGKEGSAADRGAASAGPAAAELYRTGGRVFYPRAAGH